MDSKHHIRTLKLSRVSLLALGFYFLLSLTSCSGEYKGLPRAEMVAYQTEPTYGTLYNLALASARSLNDAVKADTLHPGLYAEYGITLALMGHDGTACRMLNAEVRAFPESRELILRVKRKLLPDMVDDTLCGERDTANLAQLASWAYDSLASLRPLPGIEAVIDSTDTVWLSQQTPVDSVVVPIRLTATQKRELLEQEQAARAAYDAEKKRVIETPEYLAKDRVFTYSKDALERIRGKYDLILLTRRSHSDFFYEEWERTGLAEYFTAVHVIPHSYGGKADFIRDNYAVDPERDVIVGDTEDDLKAGRELGLRNLCLLY